MRARDWQRLAFHLLLGPPLAYLIGLLCLCLMLAIPAWINGSDAGLVGFVLFVGLPALPLSYLFGAVPMLVTSIVTSVLERLLPSRGWRLLASLAAGAIPTWLVSIWLIGPAREFDSAELNGMIVISGAIGAALAALACGALTERFGSRRGVAEEAA
jgi:hypothetical protein